MLLTLQEGTQQFTYGVVREGVIAEDFPQISAKFPQNFRKNPFANDPISELLRNTEKELELPKSDSKVARRVPPQSDPR